MNRLPATFLSCLLFVATIGVLPADDIFCPGVDHCVPEVRKRSVWAGFGYLNARADEIVYGGPGGAGGNELSHLNWDVNNALTFNLGFEGDINDRWSLFANGVFSLDVDDSFMSDYDWTLPTNAWSHQSVHPNTDLNHYVQVDLGLDYKMLETDRVTFLLRGGYRYTDISFDAFGGNFTYSDAGFRDLTGTFSNSNVISYRQKLPGLYLGPRIDWAVTPRLNLKLGVLAGYTFKSSDRDHHWLTETLFVDDLESNAFYGLTAGIDYALTPSTVLYVEASHDRYKMTRGSTTIYDPSGVYVSNPGSVGADLETTQITAGVRINAWNKEFFPERKNF